MYWLKAPPPPTAFIGLNGTLTGGSEGVHGVGVKVNKGSRKKGERCGWKGDGEAAAPDHFRQLLFKCQRKRSTFTCLICVCRAKRRRIIPRHHSNH